MSESKKPLLLTYFDKQLVLNLKDNSENATQLVKNIGEKIRLGPEEVSEEFSAPKFIEYSNETNKQPIQSITKILSQKMLLNKQFILANNFLQLKFNENNEFYISELDKQMISSISDKNSVFNIDTNFFNIFGKFKEYIESLFTKKINIIFSDIMLPIKISDNITFEKLDDTDENIKVLKDNMISSLEDAIKKSIFSSIKVTNNVMEYVNFNELLSNNLSNISLDNIPYSILSNIDFIENLLIHKNIDTKTKDNNNVIIVINELLLNSKLKQILGNVKNDDSYGYNTEKFNVSYRKFDNREAIDKYFSEYQKMAETKAETTKSQTIKSTNPFNVLGDLEDNNQSNSENNNNENNSENNNNENTSINHTYISNVLKKPEVIKKYSELLSQQKTKYTESDIYGHEFFIFEIKDIKNLINDKSSSSKLGYFELKLKLVFIISFLLVILKINSQLLSLFRQMINFKNYILSNCVISLQDNNHYLAIDNTVSDLILKYNKAKKDEQDKLNVDISKYNLLKYKYITIVDTSNVMLFLFKDITQGKKRNEQVLCLFDLLNIDNRENLTIFVANNEQIIDIYILKPLKLRGIKLSPNKFILIKDNIMIYYTENTYITLNNLNNNNKKELSYLKKKTIKFYEKKTQTIKKKKKFTDSLTVYGDESDDLIIILLFNFLELLSLTNVRVFTFDNLIWYNNYIPLKKLYLKFEKNVEGGNKLTEILYYKFVNQYYSGELWINSIECNPKSTDHKSTIHQGSTSRHRTSTRDRPNGNHTKKNTLRHNNGRDMSDNTGRGRRNLDWRR